MSWAPSCCPSRRDAFAAASYARAQRIAWHGINAAKANVFTLRCPSERLVCSALQLHDLNPLHLFLTLGLCCRPKRLVLRIQYWRCSSTFSGINQLFHTFPDIAHWSRVFEAQSSQSRDIIQQRFLCDIPKMPAVGPAVAKAFKDVSDALQNVVHKLSRQSRDGTSR